MIHCQQLTQTILYPIYHEPAYIELQLTRCPNLRELTLPKEMKQLTTCWLNGLQLTELKFPSEIKLLNKLILKGCTHLTSLSIPDIMHLKKLIVEGCTKLAELTISSETLPHLQIIQLTGCSETFMSSLKKRLSDGWEWQGSEQQFVNTNWTDTTHPRVASNPQNEPNHNAMNANHIDTFSIGSSQAICSNNSLVLDTKEKLDTFLKRTNQNLTVKHVQIGKKKRSVSFSDADLENLLQKLNVEAIKELAIHSDQLRETKLPAIPQLTKLELSRCYNLSELTLPNEMNQLTTLELRWCENLSELTLPQEMNQLTKLYLSECKNLSELTLPQEMNQLTTLELRWCTKLNSLTLPQEMKQLTTLDLSSCTKLNSLTLPQEMKQLTTLDLSSCTKLNSLTLPQEMKQLTTLDLTWCNNLNSLTLPQKMKNLTELDLKWCKNLAELTLPQEMKQLTKLDLSQCEMLNVNQLATTLIERLQPLKKITIKSESLREAIAKIAHNTWKLKNEQFILKTNHKLGRTYKNEYSEKMKLKAILEGKTTIPHDVDKLQIENKESMNTFDMQQLSQLIQPLKNLQEFSLIAFPELKLLPLKNIPSLRKLTLDCCTFQWESLEEMHLENLEVYSPPDKFMIPTRLKKLKKLTIKEDTKLPTKFSIPTKLTALESLFINSHNIGILEISESLTQLKQLEVWECKRLTKINILFLRHLENIQVNNCNKLKELSIASEMIHEGSLRRIQTSGSKKLEKYLKKQLKDRWKYVKEESSFEYIPESKESLVLDIPQKIDEIVDSSSVLPSVQSLQIGHKEGKEIAHFNQDKLVYLLIRMAKNAIKTKLSKLEIYNCPRLTSLSADYLSNINSLTMHNCGVDLIIPSSLTALKTLQVENIEYLFIPPTLTHLAQLDVSGSFELLRIPPEITQLETIHLKSKYLTYILLPPRLTKLSSLSLEGSFKELNIPEAFNKLKQLKIQSNNITQINIKETLSTLEYIDLHSKSLQQLTINLAKHEGLKKVDLTGCSKDFIASLQKEKFNHGWEFSNGNNPKFINKSFAKDPNDDKAYTGSFDFSILPKELHQKIFNEFLDIEDKWTVSLVNKLFHQHTFLPFELSSQEAIDSFLGFAIKPSYPIGSIHLGNKDREVDFTNKKMGELLAHIKKYTNRITSLQLFNVHKLTSLTANKFPHLSRLCFYQCHQFHFDSRVGLYLPLASLSIRDDRANLSLSLSPSLTGLKSLAIESSSLQAFEIPKELTQLKTIKLTCNELTQLTMPPLPCLKCLDISGCTNLEAIEKLSYIFYEFIKRNLFKRM